LVVIGIIAALCALALPAVLAARESSRRSSCTNNLRQLAVAANHFHEIRGCFPPGLLPVYQNGSPLADRTNLFVELLPFLEQGALHQRWDYKDYRNNLAGGNSAPAAQVLPILLCPSDALPNPVVSFPLTGDWDWGSGTYGLGSYGGNAGKTASTGLSDPPSRDGVFLDEGQVGLANITDGTSSTLLFGERSHRDPEYDRLTAAFDPSFSPLASFGAWGSCAWDVNSMYDVALSAAVPINWRVPPLSSPGNFDWEWQRLCAFGSGHPGGANFALADGSVRFVRDTTSLSVLQALSTRAGSEPVPVP
jgi:prepilin-type processing-associated H-X9-DG protein